MASKGFENDKKVLLRRLVALPLVVLLAFLPAVPVVHATDPVTAATLAVTGGQLAAGGIAGEAGAAALAGPVGAVVGLTLAALGVNAYVSKAAQESGKSRSRFVADKLIIWGAQAGYNAEQLYHRIAEGISVAADGTIQLGNDAARIIQQFGNWLFTQDGEVVESVGSSTGSDYVEFDDLHLPVGTSYSFIGSSGNEYFFTFTSAVAMVASLMSTSGGTKYYCPRFFCNSPFTMTIRNSSGHIITQANGLQYGQFYYYQYDANMSDILININLPALPDNVSFNSFLGSLDGSFNVETGTTADEVFTGTPESWADNKDVLSPAGDTPITLNPDLLNPIIDSLADGKQATMSIIDYLQALQDAWDQALDDVQTAIGKITDTLTGIQESIAVPDAATKNPSVTNPSVTPETTPVLDPSEVDTGTVITGFQFDLTEIFPFCLPFDVYKMLRLLDADPVAPSYRFQFDVPIPGLPGHSVGSWHFDYTIDLAQFNAVAALLRKLELLSFCIGLAYVTRSMFIRS